MEDSLIAIARVNRDDALLHLRLGFVALRLGQLAGSDSQASQRHYNDAGSEFEWATQLQPQWPYGWYGLGLAELGVGDSRSTLVAGFQTMLGKDALTRSANAFARSTEADPGFDLGVVRLSNTALKQRTNVRTDVALAALRRASRTAAASNREVMLARGRVERRIGSLDTSRVVLTSLLHRDSSDQVVRYELARTLFLQSDPRADTLWYGALASGDSTVTADVRNDLEVILPDSTITSFDADSPSARVGLLRQFWQSRDDRELRPHGARLAEHYRRLDHAMRAFQLVAPHRQFDIVERYRSGQSQFDDRGVTYIRHGAPDLRVQYSAPGLDANESWLYNREGGDLILHFVARQDVQDYRLVESVFDVLGFDNALALHDTLRLRNDAAIDGTPRAVTALLESRQRLAPIYRKLMSAGEGSRATLLNQERHDGQRAIRIAMHSDSYPLRFGSALTADAVVLAAGDRSGKPLLQFGYAIQRLAASTTSMPVRTRVAVWQPGGNTLTRLDTTMILPVVATDVAGRVILGGLALPVSPGPLHVRAAINVGPRGVVTRLDTVVAPDPSGRSLTISDLVLGTSTMPLALGVIAGDTIWINPLERYSVATPMSLYFEVDGLAAGAPYQVELKVRRPGGGIFRRIFGGGTALELKFDRTAPGGVDRIHRMVSLQNLSPGRYRIEVRVRSKGGDTVEAERSRDIEVVE